VTDVGSTTTKAMLITYHGERYRVIARVDAPTTVEEPYQDVTLGVEKALYELSKRSNVKLLDREDGLLEKVEYYSSSSAGGGLQILVIGLFSKITASSAQKAALGAGAILIDVISNDDQKTLYEKIDSINQARPDMILLTGGIDGGDDIFVAEFAEIINSANPKPRFGDTLKLPVVYAGNKAAAPIIADTLSDNFDLHIVDNLRPEIDREVLEPARQKIHELFMSHVMQQAPGYKKLINLVSADILATPLAFGNIIKALSVEEDVDIIAVDIGGATTDIFSVIDSKVNRTVSANLGMSYSIANILEHTSIENIKRWLPFDITNDLLEDLVGEKMLNPTKLPETITHLFIEHAIAREAIKLSIKHHKELVFGFSEGRGETIEDNKRKDIFASDDSIDMVSVGLIIGSGGVISHAPKRSQAVAILIDAYELRGVTRLALDKEFMMPHLGVLAQNHPEIALEVLKNDCFIPLGTVVSGFGQTDDRIVAKVEVFHNGKNHFLEIEAGELKVYSLKKYEEVLVTISVKKGIDVGAGSGNSMKANMFGGEVGLVFDMRKCKGSKEVVANPENHHLELTAFSEDDIAESRRWISEKSRDYED
jgi:uncharacterized protein (TIGR01319 family)